MSKELNYRFGLYLLSTLMVIMLLLIYSEVRDLNQNIGALIQVSEAESVPDYRIGNDSEPVETDELEVLDSPAEAEVDSEVEEVMFE